MYVMTLEHNGIGVAGITINSKAEAHNAYSWLSKEATYGDLIFVEDHYCETTMCADEVGLDPRCKIIRQLTPRR